MSHTLESQTMLNNGELMKNSRSRLLIALFCCSVVISGLTLLYAPTASLGEIAPHIDEIFLTEDTPSEISMPEYLTQSIEVSEIEQLPYEYEVNDNANNHPYVNSDTAQDADSDPPAIPDIAAVPVSAPAPTYLTAMDSALEWIRATNTDPQVGSVGGEWAVVALARAGIRDDAWFQRYLTSLDAALAGSSGRVERMTDHARVTLALTSLGFDASNYNGHDLTAPLNRFIPRDERANYNRTVNSDIFALIALDSRPYIGDRAQYIEAILSAEAPSGGWGLSSGATPEITAMAIAALALYYESDENVRLAINRALGMFGGRSLRDAESNAQMIVALTALGRDPSIYLDGLMTFYDPTTGAFTRGGYPNMMATEQAAYALVAHHRFISGQNRIYDMRDASDRS